MLVTLNIVLYLPHHDAAPPVCPRCGRHRRPPPTDPPCASCKTQKACTASSTYGPSGKAYGHLGCAWNPGNATCVKIPPPPCPGDGRPCLCKDPAMCKSLSPQPPLRDEIFAFSSWVFNGEQQG